LASFLISLTHSSTYETQSLEGKPHTFIPLGLKNYNSFSQHKSPSSPLRLVERLFWFTIHRAEGKSWDLYMKPPFRQPHYSKRTEIVSFAHNTRTAVIVSFDTIKSQLKKTPSVEIVFFMSFVHLLGHHKFQFHMSHYKFLTVTLCLMENVWFHGCLFSQSIRAYIVVIRLLEKNERQDGNHVGAL